ncbi:MAG: type II toxin-antitoxin system VapC family toxin [Spirochaetia bacterium]
MRFVIDASVALRWYLEEERHENADAVRHRLVEEPELFAVPELFAYETFSTLFRVHQRPLQTFLEGVLPMLTSGLLRYPMTETLATRAARFAQAGLSGYDAVYVALAEELGARWLTFDSKAHALIQEHRLSIDLSAGLPAGW